MNLKQVFKILSENEISYVIIGGLALNIYGSNRVTYDSDLVIKTIEVDKIIKILLSNGLEMVIGIDEDQYPELTTDFQKAQEFTEKSKWGFLKFIAGGLELDIIYEVSIPFTKLYRESIRKKIGDIEVHLASLEHLQIMKKKAIKARDDDKRDNDLADLRFIEKKLKETR